ncbi:MAG: sugar phosphate isomerase/epimerase family protein [Anaerorhabdus sp.]
MKLGINTAILEHYNFDEMLEFSAKVGFKCVEVACWPKGNSQRRYGGVSHIDVDNMSEDSVNKIKNLCNKHNIEISALAYYPNPMDEDLQKREAVIKHLLKVIDAAQKLNVELVTTFIGRMQNKNIDENIKEFSKIWPKIIKYAKDRNIKIAIENCPMLFTNDEWPGGQNLFTSPAIWKKLFEIVPDDNFGINFDPSHFIWQQMDYIKPIYDFKDRIFHIHFKDLKIIESLRNEYGILANPLKYMKPKIPGQGDVNWSKFISALNDINYNCCACVEIEDKSFENSNERIAESIVITHRYLKQFIY